MSDDEINLAIEEACGWDHNPVNCGGSDFCSDLNAMHEAESILTEKQKRTFAFILAQVLDTSPNVDLGDQFLNIHATAKQRAEALRRTLGKLEEEK